MTRLGKLAFAILIATREAHLAEEYAVPAWLGYQLLATPNDVHSESRR